MMMCRRSVWTTIFLLMSAASVCVCSWADDTTSEGGSAGDRRKVPRPGLRTTWAVPPPPGEEASYEWYLPQYRNVSMLTLIGPPGDPADVAVSPTGELVYANYVLHAIAPGIHANALVFALYDGGKIVPIGMGERARQALTDGFKPIVVTSWTHDDVEIRLTAVAESLDGRPYESGMEMTLAWAALDVVNLGDKRREVTLLGFHAGEKKNLRPEFVYRDGVVVLKDALEGGGRGWYNFLDGALLLKDSALFSVRAPEGFKVEFAPVFPATTKLAEKGSAKDNSLELLRGHQAVFNALVVHGSIGPGKTVRIVFNRVFGFPGTRFWGPKPRAPVSPRQLTEKSFDEALKGAQSAWSDQSRRVSRFKTPDTTLNNIVLKAMLDGYRLTKRWNSRYIVFDAPVYLCQWDSCSTNWFYALDLMGDHETSERLLETVFWRQGHRKPTGTRTHQGCFSDVTNTVHDGSLGSWASCNGWALWAMAQHARLANDREWVKRHKQKILDGCQWIIRERAFSKEQPNNPCAGLLYGKFVCDLPDSAEGKPSGVGYFTYTDAINYLGLHQMAELLSEWGHAEGQPLLEEAELYRRDIVAAVDHLTDRSSDPWYIPWMLHAPKYQNRYFFDVAGPINLAFGGGGGVLTPDDERISHVIRWIIDRTHKGSLESAATGVPGKGAAGAMFYSQDLAMVLLELGRVEDFLRIFYALLVGDVSHETLTTAEWGTNARPHVHSISSLIRMFRTMLIQERDRALYLLQGTPRRWLKDGQQIQITDAPTWYGPLSLCCHSRVDTGGITLDLKLPPRIGTVPVRLRLRLPSGLRLTEVSVNGRKHMGVDGEWVVLRGLEGKVRIEARVTPR